MNMYKLCHHTAHISYRLFWSAEPIGGDITVACESDLVSGTSRSSTEKPLDEQQRSGKFSGPVNKSCARGCYYTSIPRTVKHAGIQGRELTSLNLDKVILLA